MWGVSARRRKEMFFAVSVLANGAASSAGFVSTG